MRVKTAYLVCDAYDGEKKLLSTYKTLRTVDSQNDYKHDAMF
jgi:hypothetical protein